MKILRKIGFFRETAYKNERDDSLFDSVGKLGLEDRVKIVEYLSNGKPLVFSVHHVYDVISKDRRVIGTLGIFTDGTWAWPTDLSYYVDKYNVSLPNEFVSHMRNHDWKIGAFQIDEVALQN